MPRGTPPAPPLAFSRAGRCARARPATPPAPARVTGVLGGRLPHGLRWWLRHGCLGRVVRCVGRGPRRRLPSQVIRGQPPARLPPGVDVQGCAHLPGLGSPHSRLHLELRTRGWQTGGTPETGTPKPRGRPPPSLADPHVGKAGCRPPAWGGLSDRGAGQAPSHPTWEGGVSSGRRSAAPTPRFSGAFLGATSTSTCSLSSVSLGRCWLPESSLSGQERGVQGHGLAGQCCVGTRLRVSKGPRRPSEAGGWPRLRAL